MFELAVVLVVKRNQEWKEKEMKGCSAESTQMRRLTMINGLRRRKLSQLAQSDNLWNTIEGGNNELDDQKHSTWTPRGWITSSRTNMIDFSSLAIFLFTYLVFNLGYYYCYKK